MPTPVIILLALGLLLTGLYLRYVLTPEHRWKRGLAAIILASENQSRAAREALRRLETSRRSNREAADRQLAERIHASMKLDVLTEYPGIGDGTVKRLRDAGLMTIAELRRCDLTTLPGLGANRVRDLQTALQILTINAEKRSKDPNDALVSREIARVHEQDRLLGVKITEAEEMVRRADGVLTRLQSRRELAGRINFLNHLLPGRFPKLTPEQLTESFDSSLPAPVPPSTPATPAMPVAPELAVATPAPATPPTPVEILRVISGLGLAIAKADGRVAASERKQLGLFLERRFAPTAELKAAIPGLTATESAEILTLADALADVRRVVPPVRFADLYLMACSIADAAGDRNAKEVACLAEVKSALGIDDVLTPRPEDVPVITDVPRTETPNTSEMSEASARQTLEISDGVPLSADLVRRQFRLLTERYEHSRFASTDAEFARLAETRRKSVRTAAEWLIGDFNEPLEPPTPPKPPADDRYNPDLDAVFGG